MAVRYTSRNIQTKEDFLDDLKRDFDENMLILTQKAKQSLGCSERVATPLYEKLVTFLMTSLQEFSEHLTRSPTPGKSESKDPQDPPPNQSMVISANTNQSNVGSSPDTRKSRTKDASTTPMMAETNLMNPSQFSPPPPMLLQQACSTSTQWKSQISIPSNPSELSDGYSSDDSPQAFKRTAATPKTSNVAAANEGSMSDGYASPSAAALSALQHRSKPTEGVFSKTRFLR